MGAGFMECFDVVEGGENLFLGIWNTICYFYSYYFIFMFFYKIYKMLLIFSYQFFLCMLLKILINYISVNQYMILIIKGYTLIFNYNIVYIWFCLYMILVVINMIFYFSKKIFSLDKLYILIMSLYCLYFIICFLFIAEDILLFIALFETLLFIILVISMHYIFNNRFIVAIYYLIVFSILSGILCLIFVFLLFLLVNITSLNFISTNFFYINPLISIWIWSLIYLIFGIKFPIFPFYFWLLAVHVEVSSEMSSLLAGVVLKAGFIGILKFLLIWMVDFSTQFSSLAIIFIIIGLFLCAINLLLITDYKKIIAAWSILHVNIGLLLVWYNNTTFLVLYILSNLGHILSSCSFFAFISLPYENYNNKHLFILSSHMSFNIYTAMLLVLILNNIDFPFFLLFYVELLNFFAILFISNYIIVLLALVVLVLFVSSLLFYFLLNYYYTKWNTNFIRLDITINEIVTPSLFIIYGCVLLWFLSIF